MLVVMTDTAQDTEPPRLATAEAIANMGDDGELYAQIASMFLDDAAAQITVLDQALATGDHAVAKRAAHTLKGTAGTVGAKRLQHRALILEQACDAADTSAIAAADAALRVELPATGDALRAFLATLA